MSLPEIIDQEKLILLQPDIWDNRYRRNKDIFRKRPQKDLLDYLLLNIVTKEDRPILELASGTGVYAKALAQKGYPVVATDFSPAALERAKKNYGHPLITHKLMDQRNITDEGGSYDTIINIFGLNSLLANNEDFDQLEAVFSAYRALSDNGVFLPVVLSGHNMDQEYPEYWGADKRLIGEDQYVISYNQKSPLIVSFYDIEDFYNLLSWAGFEVKEIKGFDYFRMPGTSHPSHVYAAIAVKKDNVEWPPPQNGLHYIETSEVINKIIENEKLSRL